MAVDPERLVPYLRSFRLKEMFVELLGWDNTSMRLALMVDGGEFVLNGIAQKRGIQVFVCSHACDGCLPPYDTRVKIDKEVSKSAFEHLIVYADQAQRSQVWQWVARAPGRPAAYREYRYDHGQSGALVAQKLAGIAFQVSEEESLDLLDAVRRLRDTLDREPVTKRFYERFKKEHAAFLAFIKGIPDEGMQRWYASVMLNRLMFIYFIQQKGFLNGDQDYLRSKLTESQARGKDRYYQDFLCPLFFAGFAVPAGERSPETKRLLGEVPYLNGGLFQRHQVEEACGEKIRIPDAAFTAIFDFFAAYRWHLDERPLEHDNEINPDVLGYIFEKYINQKQMGAYYTKEDITEYIAKNTVIPYLFDAARAECRVAFAGEQSVWRLLREDPDRYFYPAMKKGADQPLPAEIAAGVDDVSRRGGWNRPATPEYALPTETWREAVARRARYEEIKAKLTAGEVAAIDDLITYNLDIRQFAQDVIASCEGPELLRAFWHAVEKVTVLDPTCGSGAFLFAALNILEPLYEACLDRMQVFVDELDHSGEKHRPEKFGDFRNALARIADHANRRYFVLKSIVVNNLYGVDIMDEAVEICKLRLFLKLVAQVERGDQIEPLPDIDFNIRAGNTLVGFATREDVRKTLSYGPNGQVKLLSDDDLRTLEGIEESAELADRAFKTFHQMQTEHGLSSADFAAAKTDVRSRMRALEDNLNRYLAGEYGIRPTNKAAFSKWFDSHKPFHWFVDFHGIMGKGGFDVIIGNPPYVELSDITNSYSTRGLELTATGNLYSLCLERFASIGRAGARTGVIVPISAVSTPRMAPLMKFLTTTLSPLLISNFAVRPGKLFTGVDMNLSILIGRKVQERAVKYDVFSTQYNRWFTDYRPYLFAALSYFRTGIDQKAMCIPKLGTEVYASIMMKMHCHAGLSRIRAVAPDSDRLYYHSGGRYYRKCIRQQLSNEYKELRAQPGWADALICLLSSNLYYWYWISTSDCYHVTVKDIDQMPLASSVGSDGRFQDLSTRLLADLWSHAETRTRNRADGTQQQEVNFRVGRSKYILDDIDAILAYHYGLSDTEIDCVIHYDAKYRIGQDALEDGG